MARSPSILPVLFLLMSVMLSFSKTFSGINIPSVLVFYLAAFIGGFGRHFDATLFNQGLEIPW